MRRVLLPIVGLIALGGEAVHATSPPAPADPEDAAAIAFGAETGMSLVSIACTVHPGGAPITCYGLNEQTSTLIVGIAQPAESFAFTEYSMTGGAAPNLAGAEPAPTAAPEPVTFGNGTFLVGTDIQPGTYRSDAPSGCYWERLSGLSGEFGDIIANHFSDSAGQVLVDIGPNDVAFVSQNCGTWELLS